MVNSPKTEVMEGGAKLARALNDKGVEVTFGKRSEGNDDLSTVIDMAANQINSSSGGSVDIVTEWEETLSDEKVPSEKLTKETIDTKISKSQTAGLVKNDGTIDTTNYVSDVSGKADKTGWTPSKNIVTDSNGALTTENKNNHSHGNLNSDGSLGSDSGLSGYPVVLDNNNKLMPAGSINASKIKDSNAHSNIGTSANATQSEINSAIDSMISSGVSTGTFTDLQNAINESGVTKLILNKDYKYDATTDSSLTNGIVIDKTITIIGNGHIIDGNNTTRAFYIYDQSNKTLTLEDLRIQNCSTSSNGGAIYIYNSQININNTNLIQNNATSSGGAIYTSTSQININNTNINNNNATYSGGAIFTSNSQINITHTNLTQNKANTGDGGAILVANSSQLIMKESVIKNNTASHYANIYCMTATTVYDCDINDISTTCLNVTNTPYLTDHQSIPSASTSTSGIVQLVDNLTTNDNTKALTAKQGKALADMIGQAITYINGSGS